MKNIRDRIEDLRRLTKIQGKKGNQTNEYMRGMYNGMVLSLTIFTGEIPKFKEAKK